MKVEARPSKIHGKGLFAKDGIKSGELIGEFSGNPTQDNDVHVLWYEHQGQWQGLRVTNILKYANHSSRPNVEVVGKEMYAIRSIAIDEEITFHYGEEWE